MTDPGPAVGGVEERIPGRLPGQAAIAEGGDFSVKPAHIRPKERASCNAVSARMLR